MIDLSDIVTLSEAARIAGVSRKTLQTHMKNKSAPPWQKKGREVLFDVAEVREWRDREYPDGKPRRGRKRR